MCFIIHEKHPKKKIARINKTCYKVMYRGQEKGEYISLYQWAKYSKRIIHTSEIDKPSYDGDGNLEITNGRHSYSDIVMARMFKDVEDERVIVKCTIPRGSEYYYNPTEQEYVSNQIKIIREVK